MTLIIPTNQLSVSRSLHIVMQSHNFVQPIIWVIIQYTPELCGLYRAWFTDRIKGIYSHVVLRDVKPSSRIPDGRTYYVTRKTTQRMLLRQRIITTRFEWLSFKCVWNPWKKLLEESVLWFHINNRFILTGSNFSFIWNRLKSIPMCVRTGDQRPRHLR